MSPFSYVPTSLVFPLLLERNYDSFQKCIPSMMYLPLFCHIFTGAERGDIRGIWRYFNCHHIGILYIDQIMYCIMLTYIDFKLVLYVIDLVLYVIHLVSYVYASRACGGFASLLPIGLHKQVDILLESTKIAWYWPALFAAACGKSKHDGCSFFLS